MYMYYMHCRLLKYNWFYQCMYSDYIQIIYFTVQIWNAIHDVMDID